jgi:drug/metabolite transporter (DMT)-like permease
MTVVTHDPAPSGVDLRPRASLSTGLLLAMVAATSFGLSGAVAKGLLAAGWTPASAVTARVWIGALALLVPAIVALRGDWGLVRRNLTMIAGFGVLAVATCQLAYFNAVQYMPIGLAMLIEYTAPVAVVLWLWARHGNRPTALTGVGAVVCVVGLGLVLDVISGVTLDPVGVLWALVAMAGAAGFFVMSGRQDNGLPPIVLAAGGLFAGAIALSVAGLVGLLPMSWSTHAATYGDLSVPWWSAVLCLGVISAAVPYATGIGAARHLGSRLASFVALAEVVATLIFGWLLLGEVPTLVQLMGGLLILGGVIVVKLGEGE